MAQVKVETYKNEKDYEKDAKKKLADGWHIEGQTSHHGRVNLGRTLGKAVVFAPWALMRPSRKHDKITVTWTKE